MSRLYGRMDDVYSISKLLVESDFEEYKKNKQVIDFESLISSPSKIELYLPQRSIDFINETDIAFSRSLFCKEVQMLVPTSKNETPSLCFPRGKLIEEYKNDVIFFIGRLLANISPDFMPKEFDIACEYSDVLAILLEYLYLKENGQEDNIFRMYINDFVSNAKSYIRVYDRYQDYCEANRERKMFYTNERLDNMEIRNKQAMLRKILSSLVPLASMDASLQLIDNLKTQDEYRLLIDELMENKNHNRERTLLDKGINTYGFKRLRKEIDRIKR